MIHRWISLCCLPCCCRLWSEARRAASHPASRRAETASKGEERGPTGRTGCKQWPARPPDEWRHECEHGSQDRRSCCPGSECRFRASVLCIANCYFCPSDAQCSGDLEARCFLGSPVIWSGVRGDRVRQGVRGRRPCLPCRCRTSSGRRTGERDHRATVWLATPRQRRTGGRRQRGGV